MFGYSVIWKSLKSLNALILSLIEYLNWNIIYDLKKSKNKPVKSEGYPLVHKDYISSTPEHTPLYSTNNSLEAFI